MTDLEACRRELLAKLEQVYREIQSYRATLATLEHEKRRLEYVARGFDEATPRRSPYG
jgi:outer membrane protein TolC